MYFTYTMTTRDMNTLLRFWGYLEGISLNVIWGDTLIRMSEYRTVLKTTEQTQRILTAVVEYIQHRTVIYYKEMHTELIRT